MKKFIGICTLLLTFTSCDKKVETAVEKPRIIELSTDYNSVFNQFTKQNDTLYVVNFWATWCQPCVEELPDFMKVNNEFKTDKFKMILVSLDKGSDFETKVKDYLKTNNISPDVYVLTDNKRMNEWIPQINKTWSGAIPATAIYKNGKQVFFTEGKISYTDLKSTINKFK